MRRGLRTTLPALAAGALPGGSAIAAEPLKSAVLRRDDRSVAPGITKRYVQELVTNDKAEIIAGFGLTPLAFAAAPIATH